MNLEDYDKLNTCGKRGFLNNLIGLLSESILLGGWCQKLKIPSWKRPKSTAICPGSPKKDGCNFELLTPSLRTDECSYNSVNPLFSTNVKNLTIVSHIPRISGRFVGLVNRRPIDAGRADGGGHHIRSPSSSP